MYYFSLIMSIIFIVIVFFMVKKILFSGKKPRVSIQKNNPKIGQINLDDFKKLLDEL